LTSKCTKMRLAAGLRTDALRKLTASALQDSVAGLSGEMGRDGKRGSGTGGEEGEREREREREK